MKRWLIYYFVGLVCVGMGLVCIAFSMEVEFKKVDPYDIFDVELYEVNELYFFTGVVSIMSGMVCSFLFFNGVMNEEDIGKVEISAE